MPQWYWGDDDSMWTHMRGIRDLVRSRGGFGALNDPMFVFVIILCAIASSEPSSSLGTDTRPVWTTASAPASKKT